jgi:putative hemolysin
MGARLPSRVPGVDRDLYDAFCDHLIVRDETPAASSAPTASCRRKPPGEVGSYYSETEFDLTRLRHLRGRMVEIGRSCIDADYRSGAVITLLWAGLARYMLENNYDYLIGCASISMADGGHNAAKPV